jgi:hypothetical protein
MNPHASDTSREHLSSHSHTPRDLESASGDGTDRRTYAVHIRFQGSQGPRLRRREPVTCGRGKTLWTERPLLLRRATGVYAVIGSSSFLAGLARWILSFGPTAEVQSPVRLQRLVVAEAARILRSYNATPHKSHAVRPNPSEPVRPMMTGPVSDDQLS